MLNSSMRLSNETSGGAAVNPFTFDAKKNAAKRGRNMRAPPSKRSDLVCDGASVEVKGPLVPARKNGFVSNQIVELDWPGLSIESVI